MWDLQVDDGREEGNASRLCDIWVTQCRGAERWPWPATVGNLSFKPLYFETDHKESMSTLVRVLAGIHSVTKSIRSKRLFTELWSKARK